MIKLSTEMVSQKSSKSLFNCASDLICQNTHSVRVFSSGAEESLRTIDTHKG